MDKSDGNALSVFPQIQIEQRKYENQHTRPTRTLSRKEFFFFDNNLSIYEICLTAPTNLLSCIESDIQNLYRLIRKYLFILNF